jgi:hypothetical protein
MLQENDRGYSVKARTNYVSMSCDDWTRHTVPLGQTWKEFEKNYVVYSCYWTLHGSRPFNCISGSGRPFPPVCVNHKCGQALEKTTTIVGKNEENYHANTPVLGWCACICCKRCVAGKVPSILGLDTWRECPGCGFTKSHQESYWMYPLTGDGQSYNIELGKQRKNNRYEEKERSTDEEAKR